MTHQRWLWTAVSLPLIFGFDLCCAWIICTSLRCFWTKHVSMGLDTSRPIPSLLTILRVHQASPSSIPLSAWRRELGHYRSTQNPHWSKQWSERCGLQLYMMATTIEHIPCLPERPAHWLRVADCRDNDPTSPTSVGKTLTN